MQNGTRQHKQMPDGMHVPDLLFPVKDQPRGIEHASGQQQDQTGPLHTLHHGDDGRHHAPAAGDVAHHGDPLEFFDADGIEHNSQDRHAPHHAEDGPSHPAPQGYQGEGSVGSGDKENSSETAVTADENAHDAEMAETDDNDEEEDSEFESSDEDNSQTGASDSKNSKLDFSDLSDGDSDGSDGVDVSGVSLPDGNVNDLLSNGNEE